MITTLNKIRENLPCSDGWAKLLAHLGKTKSDDEPLRLITVLDSNGVADALWCIRAVNGYEKEKILFAVWCARQVQYLMTDPRSLAALDLAERFAQGDASRDELAAAGVAAYVAASAIATGDARIAAYNAAYLAANTAAGGAANAFTIVSSTRATLAARLRELLLEIEAKNE